MQHHFEDREPEAGSRPERAGRRDLSAEPDDAMTDEDARAPDTSPTEEEPTWRTVEVSDGQAWAPPAPP
ncbi:hypothetical protein ONA91_06045 [Micromonospora sp. DR5-3]|uniref:hypothetical protein n=1 Tax=unclassified Micromonospora TaxID=2617518 RepID=UPI0011DC53B0|nr:MULTISPECIES: hypothetical protein [unclassified Micromonospora]MCW3814016.1 hypothetical protein [Micromonospora sp. DR5-3]TYC23628.1 hypothetical protein FXF52_14780 [Micromonospora sp. MP36]